MNKKNSMSSKDTFETAPTGKTATGKSEEAKKKTLKELVRLWLAETGNQIPLSVVLAIVLGVVINNTTHVSPDLVSVIELPGLLWIRALKSIVIALIFTSMILSMQSLKKIPGGGSLIAKGAFGFYLGSTIFALVESIIFINLIMVPNYIPSGPAAASLPTDSLMIVNKTKDLILGLIPENVVQSMAMNDLIAIITAGVVIGCLIRDEDVTKPSVFMKCVIQIIKFNF